MVPQERSKGYRNIEHFALRCDRSQPLFCSPNSAKYIRVVQRRLNDMKPARASRWRQHARVHLTETRRFNSPPFLRHPGDSSGSKPLSPPSCSSEHVILHFFIGGTTQAHVKLIRRIRISMLSFRLYPVRQDVSGNVAPHRYVTNSTPSITCLGNAPSGSR